MGANAVIIGPIILGNRIQIGASACVVSNYGSDNLLLVGVPAKPLPVREIAFKLYNR